MAEYEWRGVKRDGRGSTGRLTIDPRHLSAIVEDRFKRGWRELTVTRNSVTVGRIGRDPLKPRRRTWWAEGPAPLRP